MAFLRFLSRVTFIFNICYLLVCFVQWQPYQIPEPVLRAFATGYFIAIGTNLLMTLILVFCFLFVKLRATGIAIWLMVINFLIFIAQIFVVVVNLPKS